MIMVSLAFFGGTAGPAEQLAVDDVAVAAPADSAGVVGDQRFEVEAAILEWKAGAVAAPAENDLGVFGRGFEQGLHRRENGVARGGLVEQANHLEIEFRLEHCGQVLDVVDTASEWVTPVPL